MSQPIKKSFEITVRGQYQSLHEGSGIPTLKPYEETFVLPSQEAALSNICKHLLFARLKKTHPDFIRFRTHELVGIKLVGYTPNKEVLQMGIDEMDMKELHDFCILRQIMIDPYKHADKDIFAIRTMVQNIWNAKRLAMKEAQTSKEGKAVQEADVLREMNDLDPVSKDPIINVNEQKLTENHKRASTPTPLDKSPDASIEDDAPLPSIEPDVEQEPILE